MDQEKYRQVISDAIQGEIEAQKFYTQISERIKDDYLKELFSQFSIEEKKHEQILTQIMKDGKIGTRYFDFEKDFHVAETFDMPVVSSEMNLKEAIGLAMKNEEAAMKKYIALAENCEDASLKKLFLDLSAMEREHKHKMETSFVDVAYPEVW